MDKEYYANEATIKALYGAADVPFIPGFNKYYYDGIYIHVSHLIKPGQIVLIDSGVVTCHGMDKWSYDDEI